MKYKARIIILVTAAGICFGCNQGNSSAEQNTTDPVPVAQKTAMINDSASILQAFEKLKINHQFQKSLGLEEQEHYNWYHDKTLMLFGDLDGDGVSDAIVPFSIEGRGAGNNWDAHYAVFFNKDTEWRYQDQLDVGGDMADYIIEFSAIRNNIIIGNLAGNQDKSLPEIPVEYIFKGGKFINIYTALHKERDTEPEFIAIYEFLTNEYLQIPLTASVKEYEQLLGKGTIETPEPQPGCGTYFDEGTIRYLHYPFWDFELNEKNEAAWLLSKMQGSNIRINTNKGTITEKTTLKDLENIFYRKESWNIYDDKTNGTKTFIIPMGRKSASDDLLHFEFDKNGILRSVSLLIQC